jgi:hypothetical protein
LKIKMKIVSRETLGMGNENENENWKGMEKPP